MVEWLTLLHIWVVPVSAWRPAIWQRFSWFSSAPPCEFWDCTLKLGHNHFLPNPFHFNCWWIFFQECAKIVVYLNIYNKLLIPLMSIPSYHNKKCRPTTRHGGTCGERRYSSYSITTSALDGDEWSASHPGRTLPPGIGPLVPIVQEAGWAPEPAWTHRLEEKLFCLCRGSNLDRLVVQFLDAILTELLRLQFYHNTRSKCWNSCQGEVVKVVSCSFFLSLSLVFCLFVRSCWFLVFLYKGGWDLK
jgi:hypothetical protein